jgi:hypothetical protein
MCVHLTRQQVFCQGDMEEGVAARVHARGACKPRAGSCVHVHVRMRAWVHARTMCIHMYIDVCRLETNVGTSYIDI